MHITLRGSALPLAVTSTDDREPFHLPTLPSARELRRARLIRHLARRRFGFFVLHAVLGAAGWSAIAASGWFLYLLTR